MRLLPWGITLLLAVSLLPLQADAAKKKTQQKKTETTEQASTVQSPVDFADAFHLAMHTRNRTKILEMLAPDLVAFETGYLEATRDEYVKNNLNEDLDFAGGTDYRPLSRGVIGSGEQVTVLTKASIKGSFGDQRVDLVQSETMILRRAQTGWEIVHLHWSGHPRQASDSEPTAKPAPPAPKGPPASLKPATELTVPVVPEAKPEASETP